jgi:hypothetical protein
MNTDIHANQPFVQVSDDARCRIKCCILSKPVTRFVVAIDISFFDFNFSWLTHFLLQYENPTEGTAAHAYRTASIFQA